MTEFCVRVLSERYITSEIDIVEWNPKFDLLAIATRRGDVILQRLFWKKAWQLPSKNLAGSGSHTVSVTSMAWSPNGKHLAISYGMGRIVFVEIECGRVVHQIDQPQLDSDGQRIDRPYYGALITTKWIEATDEKRESASHFTTFDDSDELLLPLPPLDKSKTTPTGTASGDLFSEISESRIGNTLSIFIAGDAIGQLRLYLDGFFHVADLDLHEIFLGPKEEIDPMMTVPIAVDLSSSLDRLAVVYYNSRRELVFAVSETPLSHHRSDYWLRLSKRVSYLTTAMRYVESTMQKIVDTWEDPISSLDAKLSRFASAKGNPTGTLGDEFIQMLVFGTALPELEHFMTHSLTDKGLKKLLGSVETSYQTLLNLLSVNLDGAVSSLYQHLTTLQNLMADEDDAIWTESMETVAGLSLKITRVHDIAESNARSIGLFVRWLHRCVLTISDENLPPSLASFSDDDTDLVARFIEQRFCTNIVTNLDDSDATPAAQFGLEKVGVYLKKDAVIPDDFFDGKRVVIPHRSLKGISLPDCVRMVRECVDKVENRLTTIFSQQFRSIRSPAVLCQQIVTDGSEKNVSLVHDKTKSCFRVIFAVGQEFDRVLMTEFNDQTLSVVGSWKFDTQQDITRSVVNLDQYNASVVTALVREKGEDEGDWKYVLYQIDTASLTTSSSPSKRSVSTEDHRQSNPCQVVQSVSWNTIPCQSLGDGQFSFISVSGTRKVGCVVFSCRTRLKLLDMESEDDVTAQSSSLMDDTMASASAMDLENDAEAANK